MPHFELRFSANESRTRWRRLARPWPPFLYSFKYRHATRGVIESPLCVSIVAISVLAVVEKSKSYPVSWFRYPLSNRSPRIVVTKLEQNISFRHTPGAFPILSLVKKPSFRYPKKKSAPPAITNQFVGICTSVMESKHLTDRVLHSRSRFLSAEGLSSVFVNCVEVAVSLLSYIDDNVTPQFIPALAFLSRVEKAAKVSRRRGRAILV